MTAEDAMTLVKPYAYIRYFKKLDREIQDYVCADTH